MKVIVVGMGVQGNKRAAVAGADVVATVDPLRGEAGWRHVDQVPLGAYDAALVCTPDETKIELLTYLMENGKHVLVEKPILAGDQAQLVTLEQLARNKGVVCYTAYNHRFEPHFVRMAEAIASGRLGEIYALRMFYGNGTARLVRDSAWRDQGAGVLPDLGSHLIDTVLFWLGGLPGEFTVVAANRFENRAFDHVVLAAHGRPFVELEMTLLNWRNHFTCDVLAEKGSAHIRSLCKWGPSTFAFRRRILPSGRPPEESVTLTQPDPTWAAEYDHFKGLCAEGGGNLANDIVINRALARLGGEALEGKP